MFRHLAPLSLSKYRQVLPAWHRFWVRAALAVGVGAYGLMTLLRLVQNAPPRPLELVMLGVCTAALFLEPRRSALASTLALSAAWLEVLHAVLTSDHGIRDPSSIGSTLLLVVCALLLGPGWAWVACLLTCIALPVLLWLGQLHLGGIGLPSGDVEYLVMVEVVMVGITVLLTIFLQTLGHLLSRLEKNAERWQQFVEQAPDAIIALNGAGTVQAFNRLAESYLGLRRDDVLGRSLSSLHQDYPELFPAASPEQIQTPATLTTHGRSLELRSRLRQAGDAETDWLFVIRDVTEREEAARIARSLENQLNHIQKMDAIGQLAGGVAHDFNNLLTAVSGAAYALRDADKNETAEIADELLEASEHGASLTRQLLTFARKEIVQADVVDLGQAIERASTLITRVLGERIRFDLDADEGCTVYLDEGQLKQVVLNFAANSRDAITGHGTFSVSVRRKGLRVLLEATDSGAGMDERTMAHVFEPFFTTKPTTSGTGLGLATIHAIVTQWRGTICVQSTLGQGTTFTIEWPLAEEVITETTTLSGTGPRSETRGTVLLVEDNAAARRFMRRVLDRAGYHVTEASSAEDALALCHEGTRPHLVVTDVILPGLTGVDLATRLHQRWHHLPVLFVSGYVDDVLAGWPYDATQDLLLKPFSAETLLSRIETKMLVGPKRARPRVITQY